jgi:hypothetical protein
MSDISRGVDKWLWFVEADSEAPKQNMKIPISKFAEIVKTPVFPQTLHQFRPPKAAPSPKPTKREKIFSKSRDVREDRGTRAMKTTQKAQSFQRGR